MTKYKIIRKGVFPLRKLNITLNGTNYILKGNQEMEFDNQGKEIDILLKIDWWRLSKKILLNDEGQEIIIKYCLPDRYYIIGLFVILSLAVMTFLHYIPITAIVISVIVFVLTQAYYLFIIPDKYFTIETK